MWSPVDRSDVPRPVVTLAIPLTIWSVAIPWLPRVVFRATASVLGSEAPAVAWHPRGSGAAAPSDALRAIEPCRLPKHYAGTR
jgi:hypothetical protein